ncbi:Uncharacterised protein [Mycoplasmopsis arginini]|nr:Uncharacterised protein [Mycoplasmopsis arginini]SGA30615.1 Uncharacterised protein [Mycoplasmopsis arginini]
MYSLLPSLEESKKDVENQLNSLKDRLIKETIDEEEIASIVSK